MKSIQVIAALAGVCLLSPALANGQVRQIGAAPHGQVRQASCSSCGVAGYGGGFRHSCPSTSGCATGHFGYFGSTSGSNCGGGRGCCLCCGTLVAEVLHDITFAVGSKLNCLIGCLVPAGICSGCDDIGCSDCGGSCADIGGDCGCGDGGCAECGDVGVPVQASPEPQANTEPTNPFLDDPPVKPSGSHTRTLRPKRAPGTAAWRIAPNKRTSIRRAPATRTKRNPQRVAKIDQHNSKVVQHASFEDNIALRKRQVRAASPKRSETTHRKKKTHQP